MELLGFIALVLCIVLFVRVSSLSRKVEELEHRTGGVVGESAPIRQAMPSTVAVSHPQVSSIAASMPVSAGSLATASPAVSSQYRRSVPSEPDLLEQFFTWFGENWLLKVGVILILIGFGWFISYAFVYNWIGPVGRVLLGFGLGSILAAWGTWRMAQHTVQGTVFLVLGSAIVVITSFASQVVYDFFPPAVALGIPFLVSVYLTLVALRYDRRALAIYAVLIGLIAPLLTNSKSADYVFLFSYLGIISLASIWIAVVKNWRSITAVTATGVLLYTFGYLGASAFGSGSGFLVVTILYALAALYFVVSLASIVQSAEDVSVSDVIVAILTNIMIITVTLAKIPEELMSLVLAFWIVPMGIGSFYVFMKTQKERFFYLYACAAVVLLVMATVVELQGHALIFALAFESVMISIGSYLVTNRVRVGYVFSSLMIIPAFMVLSCFDIYRWGGTVFNEHFFALAAVGILFMFLAGFYRVVAPVKGENATGYMIHGIVGSLYLFGLVWFALQVAFSDYGSAVLASLVIYTLVGLVTYFGGIFKENHALKYYGATVLIAVILRLFLVDVWALSLAFRIVAFIGVGVLFISTAFLSRKNN